MTAPWGRWWHPRFANSVAAQQEYHSIVLRLPWAGWLSNQTSVLFGHRDRHDRET